MRKPVQKRVLSVDYTVIREGNKCGCEYWTKSVFQGKDKTTKLQYELKGRERRKMEGFPWWLRGKYLPANEWDVCSIPGSGRSPGVGNGTPFQYSCLGNPMDRGSWEAALHGVTKGSDMTE